MILMNPVPASVIIPRRPPLGRVRMVISISSTEQLRTQLDQLHSEAEKTRLKASNARLRLMRLSEAAEKLKKQAAIDVRLGKENEARELLVQKKKVMQALEKSKSRIELLDELSAKLNEAITEKETQLIGNVALDLEVGGKDASGPIRIISLKEETEFDPNKNQNFKPVAMDLGEDQQEQFRTEAQTNLQEDVEEGTMSMRIWNEEHISSSLKGISSYENFLDHVDQQLNKIEVEVATMLHLWTLVLESEEQPKNSKVQHTVEILENVRRIRGRIASIKQAKAECSIVVGQFLLGALGLKLNNMNWGSLGSTLHQIWCQVKLVSCHREDMAARLISLGRISSRRKDISRPNYSSPRRSYLKCYLGNPVGLEWLVLVRVVHK